MTSRRTLTIAFGAALLAVRGSAYAQTQRRAWRIGYLDGGSFRFMQEAGRHAALLDGLREKGYAEGRNIELVMRFADGRAERLDSLAAELAGRNVDLILTLATPTTRAAQKAAPTTPIVVVTQADPVGNGFAASLARPGGYITGMSDGIVDIVTKLVEVMHGVVARPRRFAVLTNPANRAHAPLLAQIRTAASSLDVQVVEARAGVPDEIERAVADMARARADGLIILVDTFFLEQRAQIASLALAHSLPSIYPQGYYPEAGGLMSYGADINDNFRRAGTFVDKILKGAKPADIPFEQPTRYYLVVNRKTADALGVKLSGEILARVDQFVE
jgi:putative tryptophan/tyrosine transport system substrate-binding protein